jgi:hypothetical protein
MTVALHVLIGAGLVLIMLNVMVRSFGRFEHD